MIVDKNQLQISIDQQKGCVQYQQIRFDFTRIINMKIIISLLVLLLTAQALQVDSITEEALQQAMNSGKHFWLVQRTSNSDDQNVIQQVANALNGFFRVVTVSSSENSLSLYGDDRDSPIQYTGQLTSRSIVKFVLNNFDNFIEARSSEAKSLKAFQEFQEKQRERANKQWEDQQALRKKSDTLLLDIGTWESAFLKSREPFLINFYEANCSACIDLNREWELLSTELKGKVRVAKINISEAQNHNLEEELRITRYPTIRFYKTGPKKTNDFTEYDGVRKKFSILEWINERINQKVQTTDILPLNSENYQTLCKTTKNTCIIVFLDGTEPADTLSRIERLALEHIKKPITFLISKKGEQSAFAEQAGVSSYPDTVMIYCKLKKIWRMGELNIENIDNAINEISLGNRNNFSRYNFAENIQ